MKIAVSYNNGEVFGHFGQTKFFKIYTVEQTKIVNEELVATGEYSHAALVGFLLNLDVQMVLVGGIGSHAIDMLSENGIKVYTGVVGNSDQNVLDLINGNLKYDDSCVHECSHNH